jgi:hypothetical protein
VQVRGGCRTARTSNADARFFDARGAPLLRAAAAPTMARLTDAMSAFLRRRDAAGVDGSLDVAAALGPFVRAAGGGGGGGEGTADERAYLELHAFRNVVLDHTADLHHLSAAEMDEEEYGGTGHDALLLDDFACAFTPLLAGTDVEVRLSIAWRGACA